MRRMQMQARPTPRGGGAAICLLLAIAALSGCGGAGHESTGEAGGGGSSAHRSAVAGRARERGSDADGYPESAEVRRLVAEGRPIYCAGARGDEVALTFDDGPGPYTRLVMAKLRKHHVKATFFIVGRNISLIPGAGRSSIGRQERALGAVGDHTFTHPELTALPVGEAESEIVRTQALLERSSGGSVFLFRPPYGARNTEIDSIAQAHGLVEILWTVDSADSLGANYAQIERNVIDGMHPGAIILMHENRGQTVRALISVFAALERKHLRAVSVPQLLTDDPPSPGQVRAGGLGCGAHAGSGQNGG